MKWRCKNCGETNNVQNGVCPKCGPTQTKPLDDEAMTMATGKPIKKKKVK